jgi:hypothetical protein
MGSSGYVAGDILVLGRMVEEPASVPSGVTSPAG